MTGFYELLQTAPDSSIDVLRAAYHDQVALVVRRQRAAETRNQDTTPLEARRAALAEAWEVLSDPVRRRRYDRFRALSHEGLPTDLDGLWKRADTSMVDPAAAAAVEVVRTLTTLRIETLQPPAPAAESNVARVVRRPVQEQDQPSVAPIASAASVAPPVQVATERPSTPAVAERPSAPAAQVSAERPTAPTVQIHERPSAPAAPPPAPAAPPSQPAAPAAADAGAAPGSTLRTTRALNAPTEPLELARHVSAEDLARLLDQYGPSGAFLAAVRDLRRVSVARLAETTRISVRYLEAMERDNYADLPNAAFVKGYLRMVVRTLDAIPAGPETEDYVEGFMARFHRARG